MIALLLASLAFAQAPPRDPSDPQQLRTKSNIEYAGDLAGSDGPDRVYAARALRMQALTARRQADGPESERQFEARVTLSDLRHDALGGAMRAVVEHRDVRAACADILRAFEDPTSKPALLAALEAEDRKRIKKRIEKAIDAIEGGPS